MFRLLLSVQKECIQRAFWCCRHVPHDMGVDHGCFDILVSQKGLDFTDVDAIHEEMSGETVTQCVNGRLLRNASLSCGCSHSLLDGRFIHVMTPDYSASGIHGQLRRGENILPGPVLWGVRILSAKSVRQIGLPKSSAKILPGPQV